MSETNQINASSSKEEVAEYLFKKLNLKEEVKKKKLLRKIFLLMFYMI